MTRTSESADVRPPEWFTAFQQEMGRLLRTPLEVRTGQFRAAVEAYPKALVAEVHDDGPGAIARLELYHEQYWRRLFNTLQEAFPRVARVVNYYWFNVLASHFLANRPPQSFDLANVSEGFFAWMMQALDEINPPRKTEGFRLVETPLQAIPPLGDRSRAAMVLGTLNAPWSLVVQALHLDEAERRAFRAAWEPLWNPSIEQRAHFAAMRLRYASSFSLLRLDYDLPVGKSLDDWVFSAERRKNPAHVVLLRSPRGIATYPLDPIFARLLALARVYPFGEAMVRTEKALTDALRKHWVSSKDTYVDTALTNGFWIGVIT